MRQVGDILGKRRADRFVGFLAAQGISSELRDDGEDRYGVWVIHEDDMVAADEHFRAYRVAPEAAVFDVVTPPPQVVAKAAQTTTARSRYIDVRTEIFGQGNHRRLQATIVFIALSVVLTLLMRIPQMGGLIRLLYYSDPGFVGPDFAEILHGQVWRLVTPIFMHQGVLHLLFNMLWLYQLGGAIEAQEGTVYYVALVLLLACIVNTAQYLVAGPMFIGMSGVVYALFGYVWMMSRYQAASRYVMASNTALFMVGWLVICLVGLMPGVANTEHVGGLIVGVVWGFLHSGYLRTWLRRRRYRG